MLYRRGYARGERVGREERERGRRSRYEIPKSDIAQDSPPTLSMFRQRYAALSAVMRERHSPAQHMRVFMLWRKDMLYG